MDISKEKIRSELEKLGYTGIPDEQLTHFKKDLDELLSEELKNSGNNLLLSSDFKDGSPFHPSPIIFGNDCEQGASPSDPVKKHRKIKRKTLRHMNGKAYVSEESLLNTSVNYLNDQPSFNSSTDQEIDVPINESPSSLSEMEGLKTRVKTGFIGQTRFPIVGYGVKPCDPVLRYHQYKQYWDAYKPPGEKSHKELRWFIREQMMDYDPIVQISLQNVPNICKRPNLPRWNTNLLKFT